MNRTPRMLLVVCLVIGSAPIAPASPNVPHIDWDQQATSAPAPPPPVRRAAALPPRSPQIRSARAGAAPILSFVDVQGDYRLAHAGAMGIGISRNGRFGVTGTTDGVVKLWELERGSAVTSISTPHGNLHRAAVWDDGSRLAVAYVGGVTLYDAATGAAIRRLSVLPRLASFRSDDRGYKQVAKMLAVSSDGRRILSLWSDDYFRVWEVADGRLVWQGLSHQKYRDAHAVLAPDGRHSLEVPVDEWDPTFAPNDPPIEIPGFTLMAEWWDLDTGTMVSQIPAAHGSSPYEWVLPPTLPTGEPTARCLPLPFGEAISMSGRRLLIHYPSIRLTLDPEPPLLAGTSSAASIGHASGVTSLAVSLDGATIVTAAYDGTVLAWTAGPGGKLTSRPLAQPADSVNPSSLTFLDGGARIAAVGRKAGEFFGWRVHVWDLASGALVETIAPKMKRLLAAVILRDGRTAIFEGEPAGSREPVDKALWDLADGHADGVWPAWKTPPREGSRSIIDDSILIAAFSSDRRLAWTPSSDYHLHLWSTERGARLRTARTHPRFLSALELSPDGRLLAAGHEDGAMFLWDAATLQPLRRLEGLSASVAAIRFSPDGRLVVAAAGASLVAVWRVADGAFLETIDFSAEGEHPTTLAFRPDGRQLFVGTGLGALYRFGVAAHGP